MGNNYLLVICAHPDDEIFLFGGVIFSQQWVSIDIICVTDGGGQLYLDQGHSNKLANERMSSIESLCKDMGWNLHQLKFHDKGPEEQLDNQILTTKLFELKEQYLNHIVVTHGILGEYLHPHHFQTALCANSVFHQALHFHPYTNAEQVIISTKETRLSIQALLQKYYPKQTDGALIHSIPYETGLAQIDHQDMLEMINDYNTHHVPKNPNLVRQLYGQLIPLKNHPNLYATQSLWLLGGSINQKPLVSIVIPCSSKGDLIVNTLKALPNHPDVEIVVIQSNADRETKRVLMDLQSCFDHLQILTDPVGSSSEARNQGIRYARAELILLLDADILVPEGFIEHRLQQHQKNDKNLLLYSMVDGYDIGDIVDYRKSLLQPTQEKGIANIDSDYKWMHANTAATSFYKNDVLLESCFFCTHFTGWGLEDQEWYLRMEKFYTLAVDTRHCVRHQPHLRNLAEAIQSYRKNGRIFIKMHPLPIVECLVIFGCRYAEKAYHLLEENKRLFGPAYQLEADTPLIFHGLFTAYESGNYQNLTVNHRYFEDLPEPLTILFLQEMKRLCKSREDIMILCDKKQSEHRWQEVLSDFVFA